MESSKPTNILEKYSYFLFDWDGVLWHQNHEIPGAVDFIKYLIQNGKKVFFVTNNSTRSRQEVYEHAQEIGFRDIDGIDIKNFYPASYSTALYCKNELGIKKAFVFAMKGLVNELQEQGIETVEPPQEFIENSRLGEVEFAEMQPDKSIDAVVSGYYPNWTFRLLSYTSLLIRDGAKYVSTNIDSVYSTKTRNMPGGGSIMRAIEAASGVDAIVVSKPNKSFFDMIWKDHNLNNESEADKEKFWMIGDKIDTDIAFGNNSGIDTILVLSGVTNPDKLEEELARFPDIKSTYIVDSVKSLLPE